MDNIGKLQKVEDLVTSHIKGEGADTALRLRKALQDALEAAPAQEGPLDQTNVPDMDMQQLASTNLLIKAGVEENDAVAIVFDITEER